MTGLPSCYLFECALTFVEPLMTFWRQKMLTLFYSFYENVRKYLCVNLMSEGHFDINRFKEK